MYYEYSNIYKNVYGNIKSQTLNMYNIHVKYLMTNLVNTFFERIKRIIVVHILYILYNTYIMY